MTTQEILLVLAIGWCALGYGLLFKTIRWAFEEEKKRGGGPFEAFYKSAPRVRIIAWTMFAVISPIIAAIIPLGPINKAVNNLVNFIWPAPWNKKPVEGKVIGVLTGNASEYTDSEPDHIMVEVSSVRKVAPCTIEGIETINDDATFFKGTVFSTTKDKVQVLDVNGTMKWTDIRVGDEVECYYSNMVGNRLAGPKGVFDA